MLPLIHKVVEYSKANLDCSAQQETGKRLLRKGKRAHTFYIGAVAQLVEHTAENVLRFESYIPELGHWR